MSVPPPHAAGAAPASPAAAARRLSVMAEGMVGSEILRIAADVRALAATGVPVCNLTVGDFAPSEFRIHPALERRVEEAMRRGETNYPPSDGVVALRQSVRALYRERLAMDYPLESVLITAGARPAIYAAFRTLVDPGDRVVYPVPSWNTNHYCHLTGAVGVPVACDAGTDFLPTRDVLADAVRGARMLALNSPLNPSGTLFGADALAGICDLVLEENARRGAGDRPLYLLYDQVYWLLTFGGAAHEHPVALRPEVAPYTVYVDALSKPFAATGLRVGWAVGPADLIAPMSNFIGHVGAWAPRPEQTATAEFLAAPAEVDAAVESVRTGVEARLDALHAHLTAMRERGLPVDVFRPRGAIYLSGRFALNGLATPEGAPLVSNDDVRRYLLREAAFAAVPFQAFGVPEDTGWFRLSVGAVSLADIETAMPRLERAVAAVANAGAARTTG